MTYVGVAVIAVVILGAATRLVTMYRRHMATFENLGIDQVRFYLAMLLDRGKEGSFLILEEMNGNRFLQFRKYEHSARAYGVECHFPLAAWSRGYDQQLQDMLSRQSMQFDVASGSGKPVNRFIRIDFGRDVTEACRFVEDVFVQLFQLDRVNVRARSHGIGSAARSDASSGHRGG
jgi:hypothetical protein